MQSKTSFFNLTLFRKNVTRFGPIWAFYLGCWTLAMPLMFAMNIFASDPVDKLEQINVSQMIGQYAVYWTPAVSVIYGVIIAMALWSYLYNARSVSLMHALPIRRSGLFFTNYVSGLAFIVVPNLIVAVVTLLLTMLGGVASPEMLMLWFLGTTAMEIFFFSFASFIAMFTGHILALPVFYGIYNCLLAVLFIAVTEFVRPLLYGMSGSIAGEELVIWATPVGKLLSSVHLETIYAQNPAGGYVYDVLSEVKVTGTEVWAVYAVLGVVLALLAYAAYLRRDSECAGDVVCFKWAKVLFRYGVGLTAGLTIGQALYYMLFDYSALQGYPMRLLTMIAVSFLGYLIAMMLLNKSFRVVKKSIRGALLSAVVLLTIFVGGYFDLLGITRQVPAQDQIEFVQVHVSAATYSRAALREQENIEKIRDLHHELVENRNLPTVGYSYGESYDGNINITYFLKNGSQLSRNYHVPFTAADLATEGTLAYQVRELVDTPEYRGSEWMGNSRFSAEDAVPVNASFSYYEYQKEQGYTYYERELSQQDMLAVYRAIEEDIAAGRMPYIDFLRDREYEEGVYANELIYAFSGPHGEGFTHGMNLYPTMYATLDALWEKGILNDSIQLYTKEEIEQPSAEEYFSEDTEPQATVMGVEVLTN